MRYGVAWLVPLGVALAGQAVAGEPSREEIRFSEALVQAGRTPQVQSTEAALVAKQAMDRQISTLTSNPQLNLQLGYRRELDFGGVEAQLLAQQGISLGAYSQARKRAAVAEEAELQTELQTVKLARELRAGRAWLKLWGTVQVLHAAEHEVELAQKLTERTVRAVRAGAMTVADQSEAESYQAEAELQLLTLEGEAFEQGIELAKSLGRQGAVPLRPAGGLPQITLPELSDALRSELLAGAAQLPLVRAQQAGVSSELARSEELRSQRRGTLTLGAQFVREPAVPYSLMGTLGLQLPFFDRGERERADALAMIERRRGAVAEAAVEAQAAMSLAFHEVGHTEEIERKLRESALPATEQTLRLRERLLTAGEATVMEVLLSRRAVFALRGRLGRAQADHVHSRFVISRLLLQLTPQAPTTSRSTEKTSPGSVR